MFGVLGPDPFGGVLEEVLRGRTVGGRPIVLRRWERSSEVGKVHLLFVSATGPAGAEKVLDALPTRGILTVGEVSGFAAAGGILGFRREDRKVRFDLNLNAAERAGLKFRSPLARLARLVEGE